MIFKAKRLVTLILCIMSLAVAQAQQDSTIMNVNLPKLDYSNPKQYVVKELNISGIKYQNVELLKSLSGITVGDTIYIPGDYITQAVKKLWDRRYYSDIKTVVDLEDDQATINIYMQERTRVSDWRFEGLKTGWVKQVLEKLKLRRGSEMSEYVLQNATRTIKDFLAEKAFLNADVSYRINNDTILKNGNTVIVTFVIDPKKKVKIGDIVFDGNEQFADKKLRRSFKKTHKKSINFIRSSKFKAKEFEEDKVRLVDFYNSKGYRDARILADSTYRINDKRMGIWLEVEEGKKYYYRNMSWVGNTKYDSELLDQMLALKGGDVYDKKAMEERIGIGEGALSEMSISSLYQDDGYLFYNIEPVETVVEGDSIDIEFRMIEGRQATINDIIIQGNTRTNDRVIRREMYTRPGELYSKSLLIRTARMLAAMGNFDEQSIVPQPEPVGSSGELVNVRYSMMEKANDQFNVSGGWGSGMFVFSVAVTFNNISLRKFFDRKAWRPYPAGDAQSLSISAQSNGRYYKAFSVGFKEPWLGGKKPNALNVSAYYSVESDAIYAWQTGNKRFKTAGGTVGISRRLNWPDPYFSLYTGLEFQTYMMKDWDYFLLKNGVANTIALQATLSRNSIDYPIYPTRGSEFTLTASITPPYSLFDGKDYSDPNMSDQEKMRWIEYYKINFKGLWYTPILMQNEKLVFMARAEFGYLGAYNRHKTSPFEGFQVGGDGVTGYVLYGLQNIGLRGYSEAALSPGARYGLYDRVFSKYTAEIHYPFINSPQATVYGIAFVEGGNAAMNWNDWNPFSLKRSAGAGVRLYLPIVGMIGIDWGYGFDRVAGENKASGSHVHFMMGMQF